MMQSNRACARGTQGEVLVLLHYFGGAAQRWQWVAEHLSSYYCCIAMNLPGFGDAPSLLNPSIQGFAVYVLQEPELLNIDNYTLVGHSMGGKNALQVAADAPP